MGPEDLEQVLRPIIQLQQDIPDLVVGLKTGDDAAVYRLAPGLAIVKTVDFFPPIVDGAYTFGAIAAANAVSDVYAMGGRVLFGLNVAAFPDDLPKAILSDIFRGGSDKMMEAGGVIAGGHTVVDPEPKYGLCVTGLVDPEKVWTKTKARAGDLLVLTKPLGTGVITTAMRADGATTEEAGTAIESMLRLNKTAAEMLAAVGIEACTDITGFGFLGHAWEMAAGSRVGMRISMEAMPFLTGALRCGREGFHPGGTWRNRKSLLPENGEPHVRWAPGIPDDAVNLLFDPETSGGLLAAVPSGKKPAMEKLFRARGEPYWTIGEVVEGGMIEITH